MTVRLLLLVALGGGVVWLRAVLARSRTADERRGADDLPTVPSALRGGGAAWVVFTTPTCVACRTVTEFIHQHRPGARVVTIDATVDPDLAARWDVRRAPTTLETDGDGRVLARLVGAEAVRRHLVGPDGSGAGADSEPLQSGEILRQTGS